MANRAGGTMSEQRLKKQTAIVTGGGRGIGRAIGLRFATEGAAVVVTARTAKEVEAVVTEIHAAGGRATAVIADVAKEADCEKIVATARKEFGEIHILVNNAGIFGPLKEAAEISAADFDHVMAVNVRSAVMLTRLVLPEMIRRGGGCIINMSSVSAKAAFPGSSLYGATKAAMLAMTRCTAAETARSGVRVNAICPGPVFETRMSQELGEAIAKKLNVDPETQREQFLNNVLQGRPQTAAEIAAMAAFLASDEAGAITGQSINVDGGIVFY